MYRHYVRVDFVSLYIERVLWSDDTMSYGIPRRSSFSHPVCPLPLLLRLRPLALSPARPAQPKLADEDGGAVGLRLRLHLCPVEGGLLEQDRVR